MSVVQSTAVFAVVGAVAIAVIVGGGISFVDRIVHVL